MSFDPQKYSFSGATALQDLTRLDAADRRRLLHAGMELTDKGRSGAFVHANHAGVRSQSFHDGLEILHIEDALRRYDGLTQYSWKLLNPDQDDFARNAAQNMHGGYFIRVRKGVRVTAPVESCMFIQGNGLGQNVHNIVVVEEDAELNIISGCATSADTRHAAHVGFSEYYVEKGGSLTLSMIHNWGNEVAVRPRSAGVVAEGGLFVNNYVSLHTVKDLVMYPSVALNGENAVVRFNSVVVAPEGSYIDTGNRLLLNAPNTRGEIIARTLTTGGVIINRGFIGGYAAPAKGHLECKGLILGGGRIHAIPELDATADGAELSHEAAVGKIAQEEIEYLMARGLDENEATSTIVRGFLNVDIMGLPAELQQAMDAEVQRLDMSGVM